MKPSDFQKTVQCRFESCLKKVVRHVVKDYQQGLKRRKDKEIPFCELPEIFVENFAVRDDYETDYTIFSVCGIDIRVLDDELAEALKKPVSYTHLDVYKRQVLAIPIGFLFSQFVSLVIVNLLGIPKTLFVSLNFVCLLYTSNNNLTVPQVVTRLGMVFFLLFFNLGITIFVFLLTGMMLFSQILFIIFAMFLPISFLLSMIPVSYTHLDVYKRQSW